LNRVRVRETFGVKCRRAFRYFTEGSDAGNELAKFGESRRYLGGLEDDELHRLPVSTEASVA
jgi:hypothetical protein